MHPANLPVRSRACRGRHRPSARRDAENADALASDATKLLAENVSNADTPGFQPKDLKAPAFGPNGTAAATAVAIERTDPRHIAARDVRRGEDPTAATR